jgi:competence protein ComGC
MKLRCSKREESALTFVETIVIISILVLLAALLLPALAAAKRKHSHIGCVNNLKQLGLSFRIWGGDNGDKYPMLVSETNGGAMERIVAGDALATFTCMSNEIGSTKVL